MHWQNFTTLKTPSNTCTASLVWGLSQSNPTESTQRILFSNSVRLHNLNNPSRTTRTLSHHCAWVSISHIWCCCRCWGGGKEMTKLLSRCDRGTLMGLMRVLFHVRPSWERPRWFGFSAVRNAVCGQPSLTEGKSTAGFKASPKSSDSLQKM